MDYQIVSKACFLSPLYLATGQVCGDVSVGGSIMLRLQNPTKDTELLDREDSFEACWVLQLISGAAEMCQWELFQRFTFQSPKGLLQTKMASDKNIR